MTGRFSHGNAKGRELLLRRKRPAATVAGWTDGTQPGLFEIRPGPERFQRMAGHGRQQFLPAQKFFRSHAGPRKNENTEGNRLLFCRVVPEIIIDDEFTEIFSFTQLKCCQWQLPVFDPTKIFRHRRVTSVLPALSCTSYKKSTGCKTQCSCGVRHTACTSCTFFPVFFYKWPC